MNSVLSTTTELKNNLNGSYQNKEKNFIDKLLCEMKNQFNQFDKSNNKLNEETIEEMSEENDLKIVDVDNTDNNEKSQLNKIQCCDEKSNDNDKPRIVLLFNKSNNKLGKNKQNKKKSLRSKLNTNDTKISIKRSTRRKSKDCNKSILQNAIARKEKSYNESNKPQRLTRQLKPTQKILENLAIAKQEKKGKFKNKNSDDECDSYQLHQKSSRIKKLKKIKTEPNIGSSSDSDHIEIDNCKRRCEDNQISYRRSRRISSGFEFAILSHSLSEENNFSRISGNNGGAINNQLSENNNEDSSIKDKDDLNNKNDTLTLSDVCFCNQKTNYYLLKKENSLTYCSAVDDINKKLIGCSRTIDSDEISMLRPSVRIPFAPYCLSHENRLLRHNCCPICGIFCTQGKFVECNSKHQYHKECQISIGNTDTCPHCGERTPNYNINITMFTPKKPVFLPFQKSQLARATAKIKFQKILINENNRSKSPPLLPVNILKILHTSNNQDEVFTINDLITAIDSENNEKVANILSLKCIDLATKLSECNEGTILHYTSQKGILSIIHMLIVCGVQVNVFDKDQNTPLMVAIIAEKNDVAEYLIKTCADINLKGTDGMTALHIAAKCGNLKACELLLKSIKVQKNYVNIRDDGGWTPLVWACEHGFEDVVNFLIYKDADPSIRDVEHNTSLHWAGFSGNSHIVDLLLSNGCEINAINAHGDTPLHIASRQDMYNCVIVLLARGADVSIINKNNETALDCVPSGGCSYYPIFLNVTLQTSVSWDGCSVVTEDIAKGKELYPIYCYNKVDNEVKPFDFIYITKNCLSSDDIKINTAITSLQSCTCNDRCIENCLCGNLSIKCWYDEEGKLCSDFNYNDIPMIFECNEYCSCNAITCNNRVVQKGTLQRLEIFKTIDKGWGVKSMKMIPKGTFVCEYVGEIITDLEANKRDDDSFLFDLENRICKNFNSDSYCIDAKFYGNLARFINHSCNPNLTSVKIFVDHQDLKFPRVAFFASKDIAANEELSYDYGEKFWIAKYKYFTCHCESDDCKYSEDTFHIFIENYNDKIMTDCI